MVLYDSGVQHRQLRRRQGCFGLDFGRVWVVLGGLSEDLGRVWEEFGKDFGKVLPLECLLEAFSGISWFQGPPLLPRQLTLRFSPPLGAKNKMPEIFSAPSAQNSG